VRAFDLHENPSLNCSRGNHAIRRLITRCATFGRMNARDLRRLRSVLTSRREQLQHTLSGIQQELRGGRATHADAADQAVASYDKNAFHQQAEQTSRHLRLLDDALNRIEVGGYGECVMCGNEIAITRLEAVPWTRYCVTCQEMQEQGLFGAD